MGSAKVYGIGLDGMLPTVDTEWEKLSRVAMSVAEDGVDMRRI